MNDSLMTGECGECAAGKMSSRKIASPVMNMRCLCLSQRRHAFALGSMPTSTYLFAIGETFEDRCL